MRRVLGLGWALLLVGLGCRADPAIGPDDALNEAGSWPEAPPPGFAVLPWGTRLYVEPRYGAQSVLLRVPVDVAPPWPVDGAVVQVMGGRDGFVEVAPLPDHTQNHCAALMHAEEFDVRLYVSPWALASVLTEPFEAHFDDETSLRVQPGAIVRPIPDDPQGRWAVAAAGLRVRAALPSDIVGRGYASVSPETMPRDRRWELSREHLPSYDGGWLLQWSPRYDVAIESVLPVGDDYRIEVVSHCARVTATVHDAPAPVSREFEHIDFGLGAEAVRLPTEGPIDVADLLGVDDSELRVDSTTPGPISVGVEPATRLDRIFVADVIERDEVFMDGEVLGELLMPEPPRELIFEAGAPIYLTSRGGRAGTLTEMRLFNEDQSVTGDRVCFRTLFGGQFLPPLGVCLDAAEMRRRRPETDSGDFGSVKVEPVRLRAGAGFEHAEVARTLRLHRHELRRCFNESLSLGKHKGDEQAGRLELALDTDGAGSVDHVRLLSRWRGPVTECSTAAVRSWTMPSTRDGKPARITFAVDFVLR